ncbi:tail protein [Salmonella phage vB_SalP_SE29]|uniref:Tail fibers n=2 Tax=Molineuxvirinae TaxID=2731650 RepID=A0A977TFQ5_9CAUD|nr:tail fibers [Salmonella phage PST_H2]
MPLIQESDVTSLMSNAAFSIIDSKLEAVNVCMRAIGREGVDSLESGDLDAEDANKIIDIVSQRFQYNQGNGWWFNREPNWNLTPDSNGEVNLPNNALAVLQCYGLNDKKIPMTMRAGKLYSTWNHTFDLRSHVNRDGNIRLTLVMMLPFEHLPTSVMQAITYQAACEFIVSKDADNTKLQTHQVIASQLLTSVQAEQSAQKRLNMLVHNPTQAQFGVMAGGYQNVAGFSHSPYDSYPPRPWRF